MISLLLTRKLLNQESMVVQFKSSLQRFHSRHHGLVNIRDICVTYDPGYAPFVIITFRYFLIQGLSPGVYKSNTTGTTKGAGTACPPGGNPLFLVRVARCFCEVFSLTRSYISIYKSHQRNGTVYDLRFTYI